ncbi:MAG TPA: hypothetical protein DCE41_07260 [Cytophagales bacterium]|nr:hypothetical protein [Cytophagales bacterium]HAA19597.1 hypothetical protein [Cytophagales bacterium]HAP60265.1 hypothetical protein [Cytophagales bacterium]
MLKPILSKIALLTTLMVVVFSCQIDEDTPFADVELRRMPFNQRVFLLDSRAGESRIFEVDYDFQGLGDEATLKRLQHDFVPQGGHMTMSPDNKYLTVVVAKKATIYLVNIETGDVRELLLFNYNPDGMHYDEHWNNRRFFGKITQVDVDEDGYLFLAGKSGFFKVVADNGNGKKDPSNVNEGADIWTDTDPSLNGTQWDGQIWVHAVPFTFSGDAYVETADDGEDYFEDDLREFNPRKVKFLGGDIVFTQNDTETNGFESQRLLSFTQWRGNTAMALNLNWDWGKKTISFDASQVFGGNSKKHPFGRHYKIKGETMERVTGAALTGDNFIFTSHHQRDFLNLWNLHGDHIAKVKFTFEGELFKGENAAHNWGDMAATQAFDKNTYNPNALANSNNEIDGEYFDEWYRGHLEGHQYAEVKLYRPGSGMQKDPGNMSEEDYNSSKESRSNSANGDIADYRRNPAKFVSLGKGDGYIMLRFPQPVTVTDNTILQVVETTWNKSAQYSSIDAAFAAYREKADVYVLAGETPRYYSAGLEDSGAWVNVGKSSVANFEYNLGATLKGQQVQWIMIKDTGSYTPDGWDLNFASIYEAAREQ